MEKNDILENATNFASPLRPGEREEETIKAAILSRFQQINNISPAIERSADGYCTLYQMDCNDGLGLMTVYSVFPGVELIYNDFESTVCRWEQKLHGNIMEINHCREGREESQLLSGSCLYLGEGDLSVHMMDNCAPVMGFPLKHYRGISVALDLDMLNKHIPAILEDAPINLLTFRDKFCADNQCFVMRAKDEIEHIFSELYSVPEQIKKPYLQLKVLELLLFLGITDVASEAHRALFSQPQVETVKEIRKKIISDLRQRHTIEELAKEYCISETTLKTYFKGIYGISIAAYVKELRMKRAAVLLRQSPDSVAKIANDVGYENQSKFAAAFRDVMGIAPLEYRKKCN